MSDEFGPWVQHDGKGCPVRGRVIIVEQRNGGVSGPYIAGSEIISRRTGNVIGRSRGVYKTSSWIWTGERAGAADFQIIRYRVKKPKGLTILENLIAEIPEEVAS